MDQRLQDIKHWLATILGDRPFELQNVVGDASLRRYFRLIYSQTSDIVVDIPPSYESCVPFVIIARALKAHAVNTPEIKAVNEAAGFVLMEDFGDVRYQDALTLQTVNALYAKACDTLYIIHRIPDIPDYSLTRFDANVMLRQLNHFKTWFLEKLLNISPDPFLDKTFELLVNHAASQPQVLIHGDYHSRNLMYCDNKEIGVLDFQDAAIGPVTYDLVSLLRDCYIDWPAANVERWVLNFYQGLVERNLIDSVGERQFVHWFDWMGVQRHLKAIFIFARKFVAEGDDTYLGYIPRALGYVQYVCQKYSELYSLADFLENNVPQQFKK